MRNPLDSLGYTVALGVVLTRAKLRRHEAYGYGTDTGYYGTAPGPST